MREPPQTNLGAIIALQDALATERREAKRLRATLDGLGKAHEPTVGLLGLANKCQCKWHRKWRALTPEGEKDDQES